MSIASCINASAESTIRKIRATMEKRLVGYSKYTRIEEKQRPECKTQPQHPVYRAERSSKTQNNYADFSSVSAGASGVGVLTSCAFAPLGTRAR